MRLIHAVRELNAHGGHRFESEKRTQPSQREIFCWRFMGTTAARVGVMRVT